MRPSFSTWQPSGGATSRTSPNQQATYHATRLRATALKKAHAVHPQVTPACADPAVGLVDAWATAAALTPVRGGAHASTPGVMPVGPVGGPVAQVGEAFELTPLTQRVLVVHADDGVTLLWLSWEALADWDKHGAAMRRLDGDWVRWLPGVKGRRHQHAYLRAVEVATTPHLRLGRLSALISVISHNGSLARSWMDPATVAALCDLWCQLRVAEGHTAESARFLLALRMPAPTVQQRTR